MTKDVEGQNSGDKETSSPREVQSSDRSAKQVPKGTADVHELITKLIAKPFDPARDITPEDIDDMKRQILFAADDERNFHWRSQRDACYTAAAMAIAGIDPALDATTFEWIAKYPGESDSEGISGIGRHMLLGIDHTRHLGTGKNTDVTIASLRHALKKYFSGWSFEKHRELFPIGPADTKDDMFLAADQAAEMKLVNVDPQLTPDQLKAISHYRETMKEKGQWETYTSIAANETLFGQKPDLSADDWVNILAAFRQDQGNSGQHYADHGFTMAGWIGDLTILGAHTVEIPPEGGLRIDGRRVGGKMGEIQEEKGVPTPDFVRRRNYLLEELQGLYDEVGRDYESVSRFVYQPFPPNRFTKYLIAVFVCTEYPSLKEGAQKKIGEKIWHNYRFTAEEVDMLRIGGWDVGEHIRYLNKMGL